MKNKKSTRISSYPKGLKSIDVGIAKTLVLRRTRRGIVMESMPGKAKNKTTEFQVNARQRRTDAAHYARTKMADVQWKKLYESRINSNKGVNTAYQVAVADYLTPPTINFVNTKDYSGQPGRRLVVMATDDFGLAEINIEIRNPKGELIESGPMTALDLSLNSWMYVNKSVNTSVEGSTIIVRVSDHAGNSVTRTVKLLVAAPMQ